jgi:two-component system cell cycle response regulator
MARILIVDDNANNLTLMSYLLRAFGHDILSAPNGAVAVEQASANRPDLILMDLHMPALDGFQAAERIRAIPELSVTPIIAVTASAMVGDRDKILARGFNGYVSKPITPETFVQQVERFLPAPGGPAAS